MDLSVPISYRHHRHRSRSSHSPRPQSHDNDQNRTAYIIDTFLKNFSKDMQKNPDGWKNRFRKMAANEFAFYRGSAVLYYRDMYQDLPLDPWLKNCKEASRVFIHVLNKIFFSK